MLALQATLHQARRLPAWIGNHWREWRARYSVRAQRLQLAAKVAVAPVEATEAAEPLSTIWEFRTGILDRLDEYFACMRQMKRHDPDAYALYSQVGIAIPADLYAGRAWEINELPRVTFGGILFGTSNAELKHGNLLPTFMYFTKMKTPCRVEWTRNDVYEVTAIYDDHHLSPEWKATLSAPMQFHVAVDPLGNASLLKEVVRVSSRIAPERTRKGARRRGDSFTVRSQRWDYPGMVKRAAAEHGEDPPTWAVGLFKLCFVTAALCRTHVIVRVHSKGTTAAFGIDAPRAKVFFKDRDTTALASDGKRKRIFHSVTAHEREYKPEHFTNVKFHYRGLRHFDWNGHRVGIVFPENNRLLKFDGTARLAEDLKEAEDEGMIGTREMGQILDKKLSV